MLPAINPIVYLPLEYRSREFDGKLALAGKLIQAGFAVIIGQQWGMYENFHLLPPGIVLFKSQSKIHHGAMGIARGAGHAVVSMEEEALALTTDETFDRLCPRETYGVVDFILTTGDVERDYHIKNGCDSNRVFTTGNPRVDVLKPTFRPLFQDAIDKLHGRFGRFILFNTNFGIKNSKWGSREAVWNIEVGSGSLNPNDPQSVRKFEELEAWEEANSAATIETVEKLSKIYPDRALIVRPHPSEGITRVIEQYAAWPNVKVIHEGAHVPWTLACDVLIHTSCTTGLEAAIAGKSALSLVTMENWTSQAFISNKVNPVFSTVDALIENTRNLIAGRPGVAPTPLGTFERFIHNISGTSSIDQITQFFLRFPFSAGGVRISPIASRSRNGVLLEKCLISPDEMKTALSKLAQAYGLAAGVEFPAVTMGDSLFLMTPFKTPVQHSN